MEAAPEQDKEESRDSDQVMARRCCVGEEACLQGSVALPSLPSLECGWVGAPCWPKTTSSPQAFGRGGAPPPPPPPGGWVPAGRVRGSQVTRLSRPQWLESQWSACGGGGGRVRKQI